jgi:hypothetical protein
MWIVLTGLAAAAFLAAPADAWGPTPRVYLNVVGANPVVQSLQPGYGWAITLQMTVLERDIIGIGTPYGVAAYPPKSGPGFLVFDDPDSCPSFIPFQFDAQMLAYLTEYCPGQGLYPLEYPGCTPPDWRPYLDYDCPSDVPAGQDWSTLTAAVEATNPGLLKWAKDETWVEFSPGVSVARWVPSGDPAKENGIQEVWVPEYYLCQPDDPPGCVNGLRWARRYVGPPVGTIHDPIRFGRSPRLPGLVVLADHGPGLITTPLDPNDEPYDLDDPPAAPTPSDFFDRPDTVAAWNLAGLFNSVGFTFLANADAWPGWGRITLQAHLNVPPTLFTPVVLIDKDIDNPVMTGSQLCGAEPGQSLYRLDGGPLACLDELGSLYTIDPLINQFEVTVRVFLVDGDAPDIVEDTDGNGVLDIHDVRAMGHETLSFQQVFRFTQYHELECGHPYDFDGNGEAGGCVLAPRAGAITGVPR